jgi:hypothetical protein
VEAIVSKKKPKVMTTRIPADIKADMLRAIEAGDYRPILPAAGPANGEEWLALLEAEAEIHRGQAGGTREEPDAQRHEKYAARLDKLAAKLRAEGFKPVKFHYEKGANLADVYLETGVCVSVPKGTDLESDRGRLVVKQLAKQKLMALIEEGDFDIRIEPVSEE